MGLALLLVFDLDVRLAIFAQLCAAEGALGLSFRQHVHLAAQRVHLVSQAVVLRGQGLLPYLQFPQFEALRFQRRLPFFQGGMLPLSRRGVRFQGGQRARSLFQRLHPFLQAGERHQTQSRFPFFEASLGQPVVRLLNGLAPLGQLLPLADAPAVQRRLLSEAPQFFTRRGGPGRELFQLLAARPERFHLPAQRVRRLLGPLQRIRACRQLGLCFCQLGFVFRPAFQLLRPGLHLTFQQPRLGGYLPRFAPRPFHEPFVEAQPQYLAEDSLPVGGAFRGELVGAALHQEGAVHERVVVHANQPAYGRLRFAHRAPPGFSPRSSPFVFNVQQGGSCLTWAAGCYLQLQIGASGARSAPPGVPANHPVQLTLTLSVGAAFRDELKLNSHVLLAEVHQFFLGTMYGVAPQRPGDCVQQRRFPVAVGPRQAGDVDAAEMQRRDVLPVALEVLYGESYGDHVGLILASRLAGLIDTGDAGFGESGRTYGHRASGQVGKWASGPPHDPWMPACAGKT